MIDYSLFDDIPFEDGKYPKSSKPMKRCFHDHPALAIGEFKIYGGSCSSPVVKDADVYIGFDHSMSFSTGHWPWAKQTEEVFYYIQDMTAPQDAKSFKQMIAWTAEQLKAGKKVHAGCIGGHGRTGTFLAALVTFMTGNLDSIAYVRKNYCKKAVETNGQMDFLNKHFGITKLEASKAHGSFNLGGNYGKGSPASKPTSTSTKSSLSVAKGKGGGQTIPPVSSKKDMWKDHGKL